MVCVYSIELGARTALQPQPFIVRTALEPQPHTARMAVQPPATSRCKGGAVAASACHCEDGVAGGTASCCQDGAAATVRTALLCRRRCQNLLCSQSGNLCFLSIDQQCTEVGVCVWGGGRESGPGSDSGWGGSSWGDPESSVCLVWIDFLLLSAVRAWVRPLDPLTSAWSNAPGSPTGT